MILKAKNKVNINNFKNKIMANQFTEYTFKKQCREKGVDYWTALKEGRQGCQKREYFILAI